MFIFHQHLRHVSVAEDGDEFSSVAIVDGEERVAVAEVEDVGVGVLITLPPPLHTTRPKLHFLIFPIAWIFLCDWSR